MSPVDASFHRHNAKQAFLGALDELTEQQRNVSHAERAGNHAPKTMKQAGLAEGFTKGDLRRAMNELFAEKAITADAPLWRKPNRHWVTGLARRGASRSAAQPDASATQPDAAPNGHAAPTSSHPDASATHHGAGHGHAAPSSQAGAAP